MSSVRSTNLKNRDEKLIAITPRVIKDVKAGHPLSSVSKNRGLTLYQLKDILKKHNVDYTKIKIKKQW